MIIDVKNDFLMTKIQLLEKKIILSIIKENVLGEIIIRLCTAGLNISEPEDIEIETIQNEETKLMSFHVTCRAVSNGLTYVIGLLMKNKDEGKENRKKV